MALKGVLGGSMGGGHSHFLHGLGVLLCWGLQPHSYGDNSMEGGGGHTGCPPGYAAWLSWMEGWMGGCGGGVGGAPTRIGALGADGVLG